MRCAHCDAEFTPKRTIGIYCSTKCRCAAWQQGRQTKLAGLEAQAERLLTGLRDLAKTRSR